MKVRELIKEYIELSAEVDDVIRNKDVSFDEGFVIVKKWFDFLNNEIQFLDNEG